MHGKIKIEYNKVRAKLLQKLWDKTVESAIKQL